MESRIIQIIPATGWKAIYALKEDRTIFCSSDLVAWALQEITDDGENYTNVEALDTDYTGSVESAASNINFVMLRAPSHTDEDVKSELQEYWAKHDAAAKSATKSTQSAR